MKKMKEGDKVRIINTHGENNGKTGIITKIRGFSQWHVDIPCKSLERGYHTAYIADPEYQLEKCLDFFGLVKKYLLKIYNYLK